MYCLSNFNTVKQKSLGPDLSLRWENVGLMFIEMEVFVNQSYDHPVNQQTKHDEGNKTKDVFVTFILLRNLLYCFVFHYLFCISFVVIY